MKQPKGFVDEKEPHKVCKLNKTLYGTKQASHEWHKTIHTFIVTELGFTSCVSDPCLYWKLSGSG